MSKRRVKKRKKPIKRGNENNFRVIKTVRPAKEAGLVRKDDPERQKRKRKLFTVLGIVLLIMIILLSIYTYIIKNYTITTIYVEGNVHYTNEEIINMVMDGPYGNNSLLVSMRYKNKSIENIPFIEKMDVSILDQHTVKIEVYEKALAGCVEYLERYMYFDKDGIVVESSLEKTAGVPMVTGLSFEYVILHKPLPVEDNQIFKDILSITQLVNKYNLSIDRIYFGSDDSLTLYFEDVKVALGSHENLEEKVMQLQYMLPELTGKSGTLRMENYTEETKTITFEPD